MKITKFVHACLLVEMPEPVNRTALFDPGEMSADMLTDHQFEYLDDIFITHAHPDHIDMDTVSRLVKQFPDVRITAPIEVVDQLKEKGITAQATPPNGVKLFDSPHEVVRPFFDAEPPQELGFHYLDMLSHPGDSHSFTESKAILALPVQAPWGSPINAVKLGLELKPKYIIPIHDWHWSDAARAGNYNAMAQAFDKEGITFIKPVDGEAFVLDV